MPAKIKKGLSISLGNLTKSISVIGKVKNPEILIKNLTHDSRKVVAGSLFFALSGSRTDGFLYAREAVKKGAVAVLSEKPQPPDIETNWIQTADAVSAMGVMANIFFRNPSAKMRLIGVTGTNGKTTVTYFLESILKEARKKTGIIGTISYRGPGLPPSKAVNTTPSSLELLEILAKLRGAGTTHVAMEVSSHALALRRVEEIAFDAAVFTNLKRDHLDFHKTINAYFKAKAHLFELLERSNKPFRTAVINADDPRAKELRPLVRHCKILSYGLQSQSGVTAENIRADLNGSRFILKLGGKKLPIFLKLPGKHNILNAMAAAGAAHAVGVPEKFIISGLEKLRLVPGRLEEVESRKPFKVFIDFAHTDSALETVLKQLRLSAQGRIITVFGCGGDRDKTKRAPMGKTAAKLSDWVILTNDNPRRENPLEILADIEAGIKKAGQKNYKMIPDRAKAIQEALSLAQAQDIVLIAGKGHEAYQILNDKTIPFNDKDAVKAALKQL